MSRTVGIDDVHQFQKLKRSRMPAATMSRLHGYAHTVPLTRVNLVLLVNGKHSPRCRRGFKSSFHRHFRGYGKGVLTLFLCYFGCVNSSNAPEGDRL